MMIFVTGATGFVGSAVTRELLAHGHQVLGLTRSDHGALSLTRMGAKPLRGDLEDLDPLRDGVAAADAVIHTGFLHDFTRFAEACAIDRKAIDTLGAAVGGAGKPLIVTSGLAHLDTAGPVAMEMDPALPPSAAYPRQSDVAAQALCARGIPTSVMRLPPTVHGAGDHGFVPLLIAMARQHGRSAFIGAGDNAWPAVHVGDAARAFRLAVERGPAAVRYHAVAERGIAFRQIAESIGAGLDLPCVSLSEEEAQAHFGWFQGFASLNQPAASDMTRDVLGWQPEGPDLLTDLRQAGYFTSPAEA